MNGRISHAPIGSSHQSTSTHLLTGENLLTHTIFDHTRSGHSHLRHTTRRRNFKVSDIYTHHPYQTAFPSATSLPNSRRGDHEVETDFGMSHGAKRKDRGILFSSGCLTGTTREKILNTSTGNLRGVKGKGGGGRSVKTRKRTCLLMGEKTSHRTHVVRVLFFT